jgi:hypothetical protein
MNTNSKPIRISIVAAVALLLCCVAQAGVLYDVPLTSSVPGFNPGVNAPSRTNDAYNPTNNGVSPDLLGGDAINASGLFWTVDSLTVWAVGYTAVGSTGQTLSPDEYTSLALYGGDAVGPATLVGTATTASEIQVGYLSSYDGSTNYHSSGGNYYGIWQVTFSGLSIAIGPGVDYAFAVKDTSGTPHDINLHATACPGGDPNNCISSGIVDFVSAPLNTYTVNGVFTNLDDVNVKLTGTETPEPTTWLLFGVGLGVLALVRRRRG